MEARLIVGNRDIAASNGAIFERRNPVTGAVVTHAAAASLKDAAAAVDASAQAFRRWSQMGPNARRTLLLKGADSIERGGQVLIAPMMAETGATEAWGAFRWRAAIPATRLGGRRR